MKRKLISQGNTGYTITMPVAWVRERNLKAGDELELLETEEGLLISARFGKKESSKDLDVTKHGKRMINNLLSQSYRLGYDLINITYETAEQYRVIQDVTRRMLLGFEVVQSKEGFCAIQNIAEPDERKFEVMLRNLFLNVLEFSSFTKEALASGKYDQARADDAKEQIDKLTNYLRRTIIRARQSGRKSALLYAIVSKLSFISHACYYQHEYMAKQKGRKSLSRHTLDFVSSSNGLLRTYYDAFYRKDMDALSHIGLEKTKLFSLSNSLLEKGNGKDNVVIAYQREVLRMVQLATPFTIGYLL
jgi:bifunctional DNA-binding transcriptional regulator/antitoxin component of YhaV-PrlF toxin-antitoxin module